jgi:hypothetical protein
MIRRQAFLLLDRRHDRADTVKQHLRFDAVVGATFQQLPDGYREVIIIKNVHAQGNRLRSGVYRLFKTRKELIAIYEDIHGTLAARPCLVIQVGLPLNQVHPGPIVERRYRQFFHTR